MIVMTAPLREYQRLTIALLSPCFFLLLPFLHVYANNVSNLQLPSSWFYGELAVTSVLIAFLIYGVLKFSPRSVETWLAATLIYFIVVAWLHTNFFIGDFGFFTGAEPDWDSGLSTQILQAVLLLGLFVVFLFFMEIVLKNLVFFCALLLLSSLAYVPQLLEKTGDFRDKNYTFTKKGIYDFSSTQNVIIFVLDSAQADVVHELLMENASLRAGYEGFTLFRNAVSPFPKTYASIPAMLSGKPYDNSLTLSDYLLTVYRDESVSSKLKRSGFDARYSSSSPQALLAHPLVANNVVDAQGESDANVAIRDRNLIANMIVFRLSPHLLKPWVFESFATENEGVEEEWKDSKTCQLTKEQQRYSTQRRTFDNLLVDEFLACSRLAITQPVFRFFHLYAPHAPYQLDKNFAYIGKKPLTREWFLPQTHGTLLVLKKMLQRLKEIEVFDDALILIVSDHGEGEYRVGINYDQSIPPRLGGETNTPQSIVRSGIPLVMGKLPRAMGELSVSDSPVTLEDIPATIYSVVGESYATGGRSLFSIKEDAERSRIHRHYVFSGWNVDYILPMTEYEVRGFSWYPESWRQTGRDFNTIAAQGFDGQLVTLQNGGNLQEFDGQGWSEPTVIGRRISGNASFTLNAVAGTVLSIRHALVTADAVVEVLIGDVVVGAWNFIAKDGQRQKTLILPARINEGTRIEFRLQKGSSPLLREVRIQPIETYSYDLGKEINFTDTGNSSVYRTHGWSRTEVWGTSSIGRESGVILKLAEAPERDLKLKLHLEGYVFPGWSEQTVEVVVNGEVIHTLEITERAKRTYEVLVSREVVEKNGLLALDFRYLSPVVQSEIGVSSDTRLQAVAMNNLWVGYSND